MDIKCPICELNLQVMTERQREEHCDSCLDTIEPAETTNTTAPENMEIDVNEVTEEAHRHAVLKTNEETLNVETLNMDQVTKFSQSESTNVPNTTVKATKVDSSSSWFYSLGKRDKHELDEAAPSKAKRSKSDSLAKPKSIPFFKTLSFGNTVFAVDAFNYGAIPNTSTYFLTHFHSDHYGGLTKGWSHGHIYCSPSTARLAVLKLNMNPDVFRPLELGKCYTVDGVDVIFLDANHCPGAVVILFNKSILHTGDFRASPHLAESLKAFSPVIDKVYLDTTYLDPARRFPPQDIVVKMCAEYCLQVQNKPMKQSFFTRQPGSRRVLAVVGTYTIGKERLAIAIAQRLGSKIWASPRKQEVLAAIDDPLLNSLLCDNGLQCQVHLASMGDLSMAKLENQWKFLKKHFTHLIAFIPTGWTWSGTSAEFSTKTLEQPRTTTIANGGMIRICRVPYSEHSSFAELEEFCGIVSSKHLIATVHTNRYDILRSWEKSGNKK